MPGDSSLRAAVPGTLLTRPSGLSIQKPNPPWRKRRRSNRKKRWTTAYRALKKQTATSPSAQWQKSKMLITLTILWKQSGACRNTFLKVKNAADRFRYVAKMILACVIWSKGRSARHEYDYNQSLMSFMQTESQPKNLMFDASFYKVNRELNIHPEVRRILSLPSHKKTERDIQLALIALREIPSFAEYPTPMQRHMCKLGWYQNVGPKRVIIREGQRAHNFYFILSGTVVITEWSPVTKSSQTKCMLQRGMEFGEQAVFKQTYRSATVLSHTNTELLCIDASDLASIYMTGRENPIIDKDVMQFLCGLDYLRDFPPHLFQQNPQAIMFHYFQKGQVLVRNSHYSDWIYIVKSGSISVLKKLESVPNVLSIRKNESQDNYLDIMRDIRLTNSCTYEQRLGRLNQIGHRKTQTAESVKGLTKITPVGDAHLVKYTRAPLQPIAEESNELSDRVEEAFINAPGPHFRRSSLNNPRILPRNSLSMFGSDLAGNLPPLVEGKMSIVAQLDAASRHVELLSDPLGGVRPEIENPTFIVLRTLEKGQSFGVTSTIFRNQPSLSVVSNGADCLLLSKQFFNKYCSERTLNSLKEKKLPYPSDTELQTKLVNYTEWMKYKAKLYQRAVKAHYKK